MTTKKLLENWKAHAKMIAEFDGTFDDEDDDDIEARKMRLEANPEEWFKHYFPTYAFADPAPFQIEASKRIINNPEYYEVRMWSRELAKSTRTMMEVLYLVLIGHPNPAAGQVFVDKKGLRRMPARIRKKYVLIVSNSLDNATRLLMPYRVNLEYNHRIIHDYGQQESATMWQAAEFTTVGGVAFRALGAGQSPRGTRNAEARPDILIFDDVDTDADCLNPQLVAQKWNWIEEAAIGTRSVSQPTTIIFCGNRIAVDCSVMRAATFADHSEIVNIRDSNGLSTWTEKNTEEQINRVLAQKSYAATQKEYYNNPIVEGAVFSKMAYKQAKKMSEYECLVCYTDPSYKDTSDYKATVLVGYWKQEYHIIKCFLEQTTTARMLEWHREINKLVGGSRCVYYMEEVFMQDVIIKELNDSCWRNGLGIRVLGDKRKKVDKFSRIETVLEPLSRNGYLYLNKDELDNPHMVRLEEQFKAFAPGSNAHDDGPDAVEGAVYLINNKVSLNHTTGITTTPKENKRNNRL